VYVSSNGTFTKTTTGGVIYGNNEGSNSNTAYNGLGFAVFYGSNYYRYTTVGASDSLSTTSGLPTTVGQTLNGWTKK
jgi:hypothetical protein